MDKKISIIVPCYRVEKYLPRCLESLLAQTMKDIEIICINDGSPDRCLDILNEYKKKYDDKIVVIDKKNEGIWKAREDGIKVASGKYIGFVDPDDYVSSEFVEKLYLAINNTQSDIAVCGFDRIDIDTGKRYSREMCKKNGAIINLKKQPEKLLSINAALWNKLYRAELLKKMENLSNPPRILEDVMFLLLLCLKAVKITFVSDSLVYYSVRPNSAISTVKEEDINETYNAMKEVRKIYQDKGKTNLTIIDTMAFLHLGVSLMFRLSYDEKCDLKKAMMKNTNFLNNTFPKWRKSEYLTLKYMIKNGFDNLKLWIVFWFYKLHLFKAFLSVYRFMIDKLKIDIKW